MPEVPAGWQVTYSRKYPGCRYYIKPDGSATWVLPGQSKREALRGLQTIYRQDFQNDKRLVERMNPPIAADIALRHSSYSLHPKAPPSRDHETYLSLKQQDFLPFAAQRPPRRRQAPLPKHPFDANSTYRADFRPSTADGGAALTPTPPRQGGADAFQPSHHGDGPPSHQASQRAASADPAAAVHRAFRAKPRDMGTARRLPFTDTTDYRAHFVNFEPKRPVLARPAEQLDFGTHPTETRAATVCQSLYRSDFGGTQPYGGRTPIGALHGRMLNIDSGYRSRTHDEYVYDAHCPPGLRDRMTRIDKATVARLKVTTSLGEGY